MDVLKTIGEWALSLMVTVGITGGAGVIVYRHFFLDRKQKQDAQEKLMETLQKLTFDTMDKLTLMQKDLDYWRREYNSLSKSANDQQKLYEQAMQENTILKKDFDKLKREHTDLKQKYNQLINNQQLNIN